MWMGWLSWNGRGDGAAAGCSDGDDDDEVAGCCACCCCCDEDENEVADGEADSMKVPLRRTLPHGHACVQSVMVVVRQESFPSGTHSSVRRSVLVVGWGRWRRQ